MALLEQQMTGLEENFDPVLHHLEATEPASKEEEAALGKAISEFGRFLYSKEGMASTAQVLQQDKRPLHQVVPDIAKPMLLKVKETMETDGDVPASVFFGEGGMLTQAVDMLFDLAEQMQIPGSTDQDEYAAALMGLYKQAGEHVINSGDQKAMSEAQDLAIQMALTDQQGNVQDPEQFKKKHGDELSQGIEQALRGGMV